MNNTVRSTVMSWLDYKWKQDQFYPLDFMEIMTIVKNEFPESRFSPTHLAVYKSQFLREKRK